MNLAILISPDIQDYVEGIGTSQIIISIPAEKNEDINLPQIMSDLYVKYPELKDRLIKKGRKPKLMCGCIRYVLSL